MFRMILAVLAAIVLGTLAWWFLGDDSYVLIRVGDWVIQATIWTSIFALIFLYLVYQLLASLLVGIFGLGWYRALRQRAHSRLLNSGMRAYFEADWDNANRKLAKAAKHTDTPQSFLLMSALAAAEAGETDNALDMLAQAVREHPEFTQGIGVMRTRILLNAERIDDAQAELEELSKRGFESAELDYLTLLVMEAKQDWETAQAHIPKTHRRAKRSMQRSEIQKNRIQSVERRLILRQLNRDDLTAEDLDNAMSVIPKPLLADLEVVCAVHQRQSALGLHTDAEKFLARAIDRNWDQALLQRYADVERVTDRMLKQAEKWLVAHPDDEFALGLAQKLYWAAGDFEKSKRYEARLAQSLEAEKPVGEVGAEEESSAKETAEQGDEPPIVRVPT